MECLFCAIVVGEIPAKVVYEDEASLAFLDINPWQVGHTLVIPKRHVDDLRSDPGILAEIAPAVHAVSTLLLKNLPADAMNFLSNAGAVAGQEVFHLHMHLIPRYADNPGMAGIRSKGPAHDIDEVHRRILGGS